MRRSYYSLYVDGATRRSRAIGETSLRRFVASVVAELAAKAEQSDMTEQAYHRDMGQALKGREPFPEPCTAREEFEHATTRAFARLMNGVPASDWCLVGRYLREQIGRRVELCSYLERYLEDRNFPF